MQQAWPDEAAHGLGIWGGVRLCLGWGLGDFVVQGRMVNTLNFASPSVSQNSFTPLCAGFCFPQGILAIAFFFLTKYHLGTLLVLANNSVSCSF